MYNMIIIRVVSLSHISECVFVCSMVSCGLGNIRLWRVRGGSLRSCPVNLGQYHNLEFTDLAFELGHTQDRPVDERTL